MSSDEEDLGDSDDRSVADLEMDTWAEACNSASQYAFGAFPPEAADRRPAVVFSNRLFSREEFRCKGIYLCRQCINRLMDMGVAIIPPVADRPVQRTVNGSVDWDVRMEKKVGCSVGQLCFGGYFAGFAGCA